MVPLMAKATWPNDHESKTVGTGIDWRAASPLAFRAPIAVWKRVAQQDALRLRDDPKYSPILKTLPEEVQIAIQEICNPPEKVQAAIEQATDQKRQWMQNVQNVGSEANDGGEHMAQLRALEMIGKAIGVFDAPEQKDDAAIASRLAAARRRLSGAN